MFLAPLDFAKAVARPLHNSTMVSYIEIMSKKIIFKLYTRTFLLLLGTPGSTILKIIQLCKAALSHSGALSSAC